jgi:hypothetical protein
MFGRSKERKMESTERRLAAEDALRKSEQDYESLQAMKPEAEATIRGHLRLQRENHFAERMWWAYRGEFLR